MKKLMLSLSTLLWMMVLAGVVVLLLVTVSEIVLAEVKMALTPIGYSSFCCNSSSSINNSSNFCSNSTSSSSRQLRLWVLVVAVCLPGLLLVGLLSMWLKWPSLPMVDLVITLLLLLDLGKTDLTKTKGGGISKPKQGGCHRCSGTHFDR